MNAAVTPAVNNAIRPLTDQLNSMATTLKNLQITLRNSRLNNAQTNPALPFTPPVKAIAGHPGFLPNDPAFQIAGLGASLPAGLAFPAGGIWTNASIMDLTDGQISDLQWFYNEPLGVGHAIHRRKEAVLVIFLS